MATAATMLDANSVDEVQAFHHEDGRYSISFAQPVHGPNGFVKVSASILGTPAELEALGRAFISAVAGVIAGDCADATLVDRGGVGSISYPVDGIVVEGEPGESGIIEFPQGVR